ncbi:MAG: F0F1 ATP synthase subunit A [Planctomycetales bacterium]|nr:F0F1 ATP synthase subunit A [Planctomycetales bacterium]
MSEQDHFHHVRDYTYFEVPKFLTSPHVYDGVEAVPWHTLQALHLHSPTLEQVNEAMEGKIFIPQPFAGTAREPGFLISKFMVLQLVVLLLCLFIFRGLAKRIRSGVPAKGRFWNFWEAIALFIRDEVVRPTIGDHSHAHDEHHDHGDHGAHGHADHPHGHAGHGHAVAFAHPADKYLPFVWSCFFYILLCNLLGAVPFLGSATGDINVTGALALTALVATFMFGAQAMSVKGFFGNLIPETGVPGAGGLVLGGMMFVIELLGFFIKHGVLAVRLFANIMGGHTVLGVILGFIAVAATKSNLIYGMVVPGSVIGQVFIGCLELFVAFLQAYVFSFLATIFIAGAIHKH